MKVTKLMEMITDAQKLTARMKSLKTRPDVKAYMATEEKRKNLHRTIGDHVTQYNVGVETYKPLGLVERANSWVKVKDVVDLAEKYPDIKSEILGLIQSSKSYYTK